MAQCEARQCTRGDEGSVTVEAALAISVVVGLFALIIGGLGAFAAYLCAVDAAGAAARSHAIGIEVEDPPHGTVTIEENAGVVTATARVSGLTATAYYPAEYR